MNDFERTIAGASQALNDSVHEPIPTSAYDQGWKDGFDCAQREFRNGNTSFTGGGALGALGAVAQTPDEKAASDRGDAVRFVIDNHLAGPDPDVIAVIEQAEMLRLYVRDGMLPVTLM